MVLQHTGFDELVYLQTPDLTLTIKGMAFHPSFPGVEFQEKEAALKVVCDKEYDISLQGDPETVLSQHIGGVYIGEYKHKPIIFEQQHYQIIIEPEKDHKVSFWHDNYNIRKKITPVGRNKTILSGDINFGNEIGYSDLVVKLDDTDYLKITLEVFPSKIDYKTDYKVIVEDITSEIYNLVFDFLKKTYSSFDISSNQHASPVEFFTILKTIYDDYISAIDMILRNPYHELHTEHEVLPWHKIRLTDNKTVSWLERHTDRVSVDNGKIVADRALAVNKYVTYDTKENRLTKYMLIQTASRLEQFKKQYISLMRDIDETVVRTIDLMIGGIKYRYSNGFIKDLNPEVSNSGMSLVFSMAPGYRELYRCYLMMQHGLSITGELFNVSVKDLAVLYEYWCFIKLNSLMKDKYKLLSQDIIKINGIGLFVSLVKGQRSHVKYQNPENGEIITLSYNPKEINVPTVSQKPDNILQLSKKGAQTDFEYVFDAKYKINPSLPGTDYYCNISQRPGPQVEDINTMHRYRDAIVYQSKAAPYQRTIFGAYILFPYHNEHEYEEHKFYKSIDEVNIGGLPFLPTATSLVTKMLDELIGDSPDSAFERAILPKGIESKLKKVDWEERDVFVSALTEKQHLDVFLDNGFYCCPQSKIMNHDSPIHYVAMYQTKTLFGAEARIEYYGKVLSIESVKRKDIVELPSESEESYYRFNIKSWERLNRPVEPKERGFANMFTNKFLLKHSATIPELFIHSEAEYRFYSELKRRTDAAVINDYDPTEVFQIGKTKIAFDNGEILIISNGKIVTKCSIKDFSRTPNTIFRKLYSYI